MKKVLIFGATSAIAQETAKLFAHDGAELFLAARNEDKLKAVARDLEVRGARKVDFIVCDANDTEKHPEILKSARESLAGLDTVLIAHGTLPDQEACQKDFNLARDEIGTNFLSVVSLLAPIANFFEEQEHGVIAVISSVAGDRGRKSNYVYGAAKGGLSIFLQGLRNRLSNKGVTVTTIKPGFVDSPMTAHLKKGLLFAKTKVVAYGIYRAILKKRDVVYLPCFWRIIMLIIKLVPEKFFKKLNF